MPEFKTWKLEGNDDVVRGIKMHEKHSGKHENFLFTLHDSSAWVAKPIGLETFQASSAGLRYKA